MSPVRICEKEKVWQAGTPSVPACLFCEHACRQGADAAGALRSLRVNVLPQRQRFSGAQRPYTAEHGMEFCFFPGHRRDAPAAEKEPVSVLCALDR